jgi:prepilin-type N-terminal cleavage/methylation domain-containing protein
MTRRNGVTLVEVLVAIFIMGIGLITLLTLFPIGLLRMAQGILDARTAQAGQIADKLSIMQNIRDDQAVRSIVVAPFDPYNNNGAMNLPNPDVFFNPWPQNNGAPALPNADPYGESYPILVDPIGFIGSAGSAQHWVAGLPGSLRRRPVGFTAAIPDVFRNFTLWDDINFDGTIVPGTPQISGVAVLRDTRISWAYLLRRPQTADRSVVDCSIIVFNQRPLASAGDEYVYPNTAYFNPTNNTITIDYSGPGVIPPPLRAGDWILDSSLYNNATMTPCAQHAYFYRVVAIEELGGNVARYEVQNPIRGFQGGAAMPVAGYQGTAIIMSGVAEVFEKGPMRLP